MRRSRIALPMRLPLALSPGLNPVVGYFVQEVDLARRSCDFHQVDTVLELISLEVRRFVLRRNGVENHGESWNL